MRRGKRKWWWTPTWGVRPHLRWRHAPHPHGVDGECLHALRQAHHSGLSSDVSRELVSGRPALDSALNAPFALIAVHATVLDAPPLPTHVTADPDDKPFLAAAVAGAASWIVSGDKLCSRYPGGPTSRCSSPVSLLTARSRCGTTDCTPDHAYTTARPDPSTVTTRAHVPANAA